MYGIQNGYLFLSEFIQDVYLLLPECVQDVYLLLPECVFIVACVQEIILLSITDSVYIHDKNKLVR